MTEPNDSQTPPVDPPDPEGSGSPPREAGAAASPPPTEPRPASEWREPPWFPPRDRSAARRASVASIVVGLIILGIGIYYFLDRTLGIAMPPIRWASLWPIVLIVIGGLILFQSFNRR
jgi:hypothetical protein